MSRLALWQGANIDDECKRIIADSESRWSRLPNMTRALALSPDLLKAEDVWFQAILMKGKFPLKFKEAVIAAVAAARKCEYVASARAYMLQKLEEKPEKIEGLLALDFSMYDAGERAILGLAAKAAQDPKGVTDKDFNILRGFYSPAEIMEVFAAIMAAVGYCTFADLLALRVDEGMDRGLKEKWK